MASFWTLDKTSNLLFLGCIAWVMSGFLQLLGVQGGWVVFFLIWIGSAIVYLAMCKQKVSAEGKAVLITGCDSGFGHDLALRLHSLGFVVFAGCLSSDKGDGASTLKKINSERLRVIQLDLTSPQEIISARKLVEELLPSGVSLWALVNNAGVSSFGHIEWVPLEEYRRLADVNIFGLLDVTKTFLPLIRRSHGRIVNVSSLLGHHSKPSRSPYTFTKFAVEALSDSLRYEMRPWNVDVIIIEPGNAIAATKLLSEESLQETGKQMWSSMSEELRSDYGEEYFEEQVDIMKNFLTLGYGETETVVNAMEEALTQRFPQVRYEPMTLSEKVRRLVGTHLPELVFEALYIHRSQLLSRKD